MSLAVCQIVLRPPCVVWVARPGGTGLSEVARLFRPSGPGVLAAWHRPRPRSFFLARACNRLASLAAAAPPSLAAQSRAPVSAAAPPRLERPRQSGSAHGTCSVRQPPHRLASEPRPGCPKADNVRSVSSADAMTCPSTTQPEPDRLALWATAGGLRRPLSRPGPGCVAAERAWVRLKQNKHYPLWGGGRGSDASRCGSVAAASRTPAPDASSADAVGAPSFYRSPACRTRRRRLRFYPESRRGRTRWPVAHWINRRCSTPARPLLANPNSRKPNIPPIS